MLSELVNTSTGPRTQELEIDKDEEQKFYDMLSNQVIAHVKLFEWKLNSVLKERESAITIIENIAKRVFEIPNQTGSNSIRAKQGSMIVPIGIK